MKNQYILTAKNGKHGLDIYLSTHGKEHYVTTRRRNGLLYSKLADGVSIGELRHVRPNYTRSEQKYYHYARYLLKIVS